MSEGFKAYAVLAGGGIKAAALAGCLKGAAEADVQFVGYGGTSAGSIVALLASIGYSPDELYAIVCDDLNFNLLLDDGGTELTHWENIIGYVMALKTLWGRFGALGSAWWNSRERLSTAFAAKGIYNGHRLEAKIRELIVRKHRKLENVSEITFRDLRELGCAPLKIVASNLQTRRSVVASDDPGSLTTNVLTAIRASCSYPFLFQPVMLHRAALVDGGLSSNLPVWLFNNERNIDELPLVAFDLTTTPSDVFPSDYRPHDFLMDVVETALESGDALLRQGTERLLHVEVPLDPAIRWFHFGIEPRVRRDLYREGERCALSFFTSRFGARTASFRETVDALEARYGDRDVIRTALAACVRQILSSFPLSGSLRAYVMLPFENGTRLIIVYQSGMDDDPDVDLSLLRGAGPGGDAMQIQRPVLTDWRSIRQNPGESRMTRAEINKIPLARRGVASAPVFDLRRATTIEDGVLQVSRIRGTLSIDTDRSSVDAGWSNERDVPYGGFVKVMMEWADVIGRLLN